VVLIVLSLTLLAISAGAGVARVDYSLADEWGELGSADGQFRRPMGIDVDQAGNIYVADMLTGRIQKFDSGGGRLAAWGGIGVNDGQFDELIDVDVDFAGNVYALDIKGNTVQRFDGAGGFITSWPAKRPDLNVLTSITVGGISADSAGDIYVSISPQAAVRIFDGTGRTHRAEINSTSGATLDVPTGIAVASDGTIYVADTFNRRVQSFGADGSASAQIIGSATPDGVFRMLARGDVEVDGQGNLYVADFANGRIHIFKSDGTFDDSFEVRDSSGRLALPGGIAVDAEGNVYVTAYYLGKVLKFARTATS
jgi:DNA-binding beta-propeller fold protein YncE